MSFLTLGRLHAGSAPIITNRLWSRTFWELSTIWFGTSTSRSAIRQRFPPSWFRAWRLIT